MAGISLRSLLNYKNAGTVTAWKIEGANRVRYDWKKVLKQLGKTQKATPAKAVTLEATPNVQDVQNKVAEVKQTLETSVQAPSSKAVDVAGAEAVEQKTVESWVDNAERQRDESTKRLHKVFAEQRANFLKTPKERERDALAAKAGVLPQWQDPFS